MNSNTERWEDEDHVVTIDGAPIGCTLSKRDADVVVRWLRSVSRDKMLQCLSPAQKQEENG